MKTAVVLLNLGGPSKQADIAPFLFNFFMDKNIIAAPLPVRYLIAKWIAFKRGRGAADSAYKYLNYKSPLLENSKAQATALQTELQKRGMDATVFVSMRYWHPLARDVANDIAAQGFDQTILLPLYPQFSTTTTGSSFENWPTSVAGKIGCYPLNDGFTAASADNIKQALQNAPAHTRVLFSAHGLPEKIVAGGDPYQWQCEQSAAKIAKAAGLADWQICYQSRVGPLKWIGPSTEEALKKAAQDGVGVVIYPHAFVSEHVETLVEIDIEYRELAHKLGIGYFEKVQTVGTHPAFIAGLADLAEQQAQGKSCARICPASFTRCGCKG